MLLITFDSTFWPSFFHPSFLHASDENGPNLLAPETFSHLLQVNLNGARLVQLQVAHHRILRHRAYSRRFNPCQFGWVTSPLAISGRIYNEARPCLSWGQRCESELPRAAERRREWSEAARQQDWPMRLPGRKSASDAKKQPRKSVRTNMANAPSVSTNTEPKHLSTSPRRQRRHDRYQLLKLDEHILIWKIWEWQQPLREV